MLLVASALKGYAIEASDGRLGTVSDFLFDDKTWKLRWLVVDVGSWLVGRTVLIHPSAIAQADSERRELGVTLTKGQVESSPETRQDEPVSRQIEYNLHSYYGWDPLWAGNSYFGGGAMASPLLSPSISPPLFGEAAGIGAGANEGDPHLRSIAAVTGCHIHASDGHIGHIADFLVDSASWTIHYLIVDTRNWWPGRHVLISPHAVQDISYLEHEIRLTVSKERVMSSPVWEPSAIIERAFQQRLHRHYAWPGYGW
jgi:sporulation protein YlmC with PRC-barrel domain